MAFGVSRSSIRCVLFVILLLMAITRWVGAQSTESGVEATRIGGNVEENGGGVGSNDLGGVDFTTEDSMRYSGYTEGIWGDDVIGESTGSPGRVDESGSGTDAAGEPEGGRLSSNSPEASESNTEATIDAAVTDEQENQGSGSGDSNGYTEEPENEGVTASPANELAEENQTQGTEQPEPGDLVSSEPEIFEAVSSSTVENRERVGNDGDETSSAAPVTEVNTEGPVEFVDNRVKIAFVYEADEDLDAFDNATSLIDPGMINIVERIPAFQTLNAVGLVTSLCATFDNLLQDPLMAPDLLVDATKSGIPSESVKVIARYLRIPTVSTTVGSREQVREWSTLNDLEAEYLIRINPPSDTMEHMIRTTAELRRMTNAIVLFQKNYEMYHLYHRLFRDMNVMNKLELLDSGSKMDFHTRIRAAIKAKFTNFFFVGHPNVLCNAVDAILQLEQEKVLKNSTDDKFTWHGFSLTRDEANLQCRCSSTNSSFNMVVVKPSGEPRPNGSKKLDANMAFVSNLVMDVVDVVWDMKTRYIWKDHPVLTCKDFALDQAKSNFTIHIREELSKAMEGNRTRGKYELYKDFHQASASEDFVFSSSVPCEGRNTVLGTWKNEAGFDSVPSMFTAHTHLKIVTVINEPFVFKMRNCKKPTKKEKELASPHKHCYYGYSIELLDQFAKRMNFTYDIYHVHSYGYPSQEPKKSWDGVMKILMEKKADIAIGAMTVMPEREQYVDFSRSYHPPAGITFIMQKPKTGRSLFQFMTVLENDVWWCILGAYFFTTGLLFIFDQYGPSSYPNNKELYEDEIVRIFSLKECLWFCFSSMTPQGGGEAPKGLSGRLIASTWWLFSFIIIASYTANLAAFLTVTRLAKPISSFTDLINQYRVQYYPVAGGSTHHYFDRLASVEEIFYEKWKRMSLDDSISDYTRSTYGVWTYPIKDTYTKVWQAIVENQPPETVEEAVDRLKFGNRSNPHQRFALLSEHWDLRFLEMIHCELEVIGEPFSRRNYAIGVPKGSPLKDIINKKIWEMEQDRTLEYLWDRWWKHNPFDKKCARGYRVEDGINFDNMGGLFIILGGGLTVTVLSMVTECIIYNCRGVLKVTKQKIVERKWKLRKWMFPNREQTNFKTNYKTTFWNSIKIGAGAAGVKAEEEENPGKIDVILGRKKGGKGTAAERPDQEQPESGVERRRQSPTEVES